MVLHCYSLTDILNIYNNYFLEEYKQLNPKLRVELRPNMLSDENFVQITYIIIPKFCLRSRCNLQSGVIQLSDIRT